MKQWEVQWTLYQQRLAGIKLSASRYRGPSEHDECVRDIKFLLDEIGRLTHMMELKQAPPAGQRWTRDKPTVEGWYWFAFGTHDTAEVVRLLQYACVPFGSVGLMMERMNCEPRELLDGWWYGPLDELPMPRHEGPLTPNEAME